MMITLGGNRRANKHATPFRGEKRKAPCTGGWKEGIDLDRSISVNIMVTVYLVFMFMFLILPTFLRDMNGNESI